MAAGVRSARLLACTTVAILALAAGGPGDADSEGAGAAGAAAGAPVTTNCPAIRVLPPVTAASREPRVSGGCAFSAEGAFAMHMLSVVDDLDFAECDVVFTIRVDGSGRVRLDDMWVRGTSPCNDVRPCQEEYQDLRPWRGTIAGRAGDGLRLSLKACFDTCMGRFAGPLETTLTPTSDRGWRLSLDPGAGRIGDSGWRLEGSGWRLSPTGGPKLRILDAD